MNRYALFETAFNIAPLPLKLLLQSRCTMTPPPLSAAYVKSVSPSRRSRRLLEKNGSIATASETPLAYSEPKPPPKKRPRYQRTANANQTNIKENTADSLADSPPPAKKSTTSSPVKAKSKAAAPAAPPVPIYPAHHADFEFGDPPKDPLTLRLVTWNVASLRSVVRNGFFQTYLEQERPHVLCLQETKMTAAAEKEMPLFVGYHVEWFHSDRKGLSGVATFVREDMKRLGLGVEKVQRGLGEPIADGEGRVLTTYLSTGLCVVNAYVPNSGGQLARLDYRTSVFEPAMRDYLASLACDHRVIYCGDLNVAHEEIDIHNSKGNTKSAGHTPQERKQFGELLRHGATWTDCFRSLHADYPGYTFYSRRFGPRLKLAQKGWRLDYFIVDSTTASDGAVVECFVRPDVDGSDHYPLVLDFQLPSSVRLAEVARSP